MLKLGLVGLGKIARDQHLPSIERTPGVELVAVASRNVQAEGMANYPALSTMLTEHPDLDAVVLCQPPQVRYEAARLALAAGKHVFLEKPPGVSVSEVEALVALAEQRGVTLFASWHSRYAAAVRQSRDWLPDKTIRRASIAWKEDVRHWHPGQAWIWQAGGFGVFDPGINALSILTGIVPEPIRLASAELEIPSNRSAPIGAVLAMETASGAPIDAMFDWRQTGPQTWDIEVETDRGILLLSHGGNSLAIDGTPQPVGQEEEYPAMYRRFVELIAHGRCDVDVRPLQLVADAFLCARFHPTDAFED